MKFLIFFSFLFFTQNLWANCTLSVEVRDTVGLATYDYLQRAEEKALKMGCTSILVRINTPGGSLQTTRKIIEQIMASPIPYLCLVHPVGGHAGSAGAIIMQACHVNGAVEGTNLGAATPISGMGQEIPEDLKKKLFEDTRSWVEGLAKYRGRNLDFAKEIILDAKALDADSALQKGAIDVVPKGIDDFLAFAIDKPVRLNSDEKTPVQVGVVETFVPDLRHNVMQVLSDPQWAYLIFMGSLGLLYFEMTHPGSILPGVVGAMGVVLSLMNFHMLDVSWGGIIFIFLGVAFMFAELFVPSFGALGIGGLISFIAGSLFLFDGDIGEPTIPKALIFSTSFILFLIMAGLSYLALGATQKGQENREKENWVGEKIVVKDFDLSTGLGMGKLKGELWKIQSTDPLQPKEKAIVEKVDGLTLYVKKLKS